MTLYLFALRCIAVLVCAGLFAIPSGRADDLAPGKNATVVGKSYAEWIAACKKLPTNRQLRGRMPPKDSLPLKDFGEFDKVLSEFLLQTRSGSLSDSNRWVNQMPSADFFDRATSRSAD